MSKAKAGNVRRIFKYSFLILLLALFVPLLYKATLNYRGYCTEEGRILSDEEMIKIAFEKGNRNLTIRIKSGNKYENMKRIPYSSFEEFLQKNPDCCSFGPTALAPGAGSWPRPTFLNRILGIHRGYVQMKYISHYYDPSGQIKTEEVLGSRRMKNCGTVH